jgi:hypothetical protein
MRRHLAAIGAVTSAGLAALLAFQLLFGVSLAGAWHPYWDEPFGDMRTMMTGYLGLLHDRWRFPLAVTTLIRWPQPISIVYTDSIPGLSVLLKASGVGDRVNPLGLFLLLSWILQPLAVAAVLWASGVRRASALMLGALLALVVPVWLIRQFAHVALSGHWLILFALALSISSTRSGLSWAKVAGFALLAALAAGVHAYHLPPVGALFAAALISEVAQRRPRALIRTAAAAAIVLSALISTAYGLGYWVGRGQPEGGAALGVFSMNLVYPVLPQASAIAGHRSQGAGFTGQFDPTGAQAIGGYNYLGAGILLLLTVASVLAFARRGPREAVRAARFGPLVLMLFLLALAAVGPRAYLGHWVVWDVGRPTGPVGDWLGLFRVHGRLFTAVAYALLALAIVQIDRRVPPRLAGAILAVALALQTFDMSQVLRGLHAFYAKPTLATYEESFRTAPALAGRVWRFAPPVECLSFGDGETLAQLSHLALARGGASTSTATARRQAVSCEPPPDALAPAAPGDRRITAVIGNPTQPEAYMTAFRDRPDCLAFSRGLLCGQGLAGVPGLGPPRLEPPGHWIAAQTFPTTNLRRPAILGPGWSISERGGVWSDGPQAILRLPVSLAAGGEALRLVVDVYGFTGGGRFQRVEVRSGGRLLAVWTVIEGVYAASVPVPPGASTVDVSLRFPDAAAPADVTPGNPDRRKLALTLREVKVLRLASAKGG